MLFGEGVAHPLPWVMGRIYVRLPCVVWPWSCKVLPAFQATPGSCYVAVVCSGTVRTYSRCVERQIEIALDAKMKVVRGGWRALFLDGSCRCGQGGSSCSLSARANSNVL